jgi:NTE family protein
MTNPAESRSAAVPAQSGPRAVTVSRGGAGIPLDLVLEGGGVKGIGLAGAVIELDKAGYTFPRVAGTSAGAIAAALIAALNAAGKPLSMLNDILATVEYTKFMNAGRLVSVKNLVLHMGLYDGEYLVTWLGDALRQIGVTEFGQLRLDDPGADASLTDAQRYSLVVHTADITRGRCVRLPWDYPVYGMPDIDQLPIVDAVRASMAIPFFFEPVRFTAPAATVDDVRYERADITWVDGGMLSNFPVEVFDRSDGVASRWGTLGIKLSAKQTTVTAERDVDNVLSESVACLHTLMDNADRYYVTPDKAARTIFVDNAGRKATDFHLSRDDQATLYANGRTAAATWIAAQQLMAAGPAGGVSAP